MSFEAIAERRIREAMERGELEGLQSRGRPIDLDEYFSAPAETRLACSILKNSGFVPPAVETLAEISSLKSLMREAAGDEAYGGRAARLNLLTARLESELGRPLCAGAAALYKQALCSKLLR